MSSKPSFVHLHNHSEFSMLDGAAKVDDLIAEVARQEMPAFAISDHGYLYAMFEAYTKAKAAGIKFIPGVETYVAPGSRFERKLPEGERKKTDKYTHMTMWAMDNQGYHNLIKLASLASIEGFYFQPRVDRDLLSQYHEGIVASTGCVGGEVAQLIYRGHYDKAKQAASEFADIFGKDNFYVELMKHNIEIERTTYPGLLRLAKELDLPLVATNDLHYVHQKDATAHDALLCIQTGATLHEEKRFKFENQEFYLKSAQQMRDLFEDAPGACDNTLVIAERSNVTIESGLSLLPQFDIPEGHTSETYLRERVVAGMHRRFGPEPEEKVVQQVEYELGVINQMGFPDYFLIVEDLIAHAKEVGIRVGPGRGCLSADSKVVTPTGLVPIADIKTGDLVFDETGAQVAVTNTFVYDCDEPLVELKAFFGGKGNKMTSDHKVLVSKPQRVTSKHKLAQGYRYETDISEPQWIRADEVEVGDLVVTPKLKFPDALKPFVIDQPRYERVIGTYNAVSSNSIAAATGTCLPSVRRVLNGKVSERAASHKAVVAHLETLGYTLASARAATRRVTISNSTLPLDKDTGMLLGLFISDGWIRSDSRAVVGFAANRSEDDGTIPALIERVLGVKPSYHDHATKNLRQYSVVHRGVADFFKKLFPDYKFTAHSKYIPGELLDSSEEFRQGLLEGLWMGDGTHKERTKYTTVSQRLAEGVFTLLNSLGLAAGIKRAVRTDSRLEYNKSGESRHEYSVLSAHNFDEIKRQCGVSFDGKYTYYRVRSVETVAPEGKVYDFTVPTTHSYATDSFVVHNSAAGSVLAYCLGITGLDPIEHRLVFERFLNPERVSMPDIDIDFDERRRGEMIEYSVRKYGSERVCQIVTYGTIKAKAALKDAGRVLGMPYAMGDKLTKAMPAMVMGKDMALKDCFDPKSARYGEAGEIRELADSDPNNRTIVDTALGLEGLKRQVGVHAAGVIISGAPLTDLIPIWRREADGAMVTQYDMGTCEKIGLLKMDFLGLRNLTIMDDALENILRNKGETVVLEDLPLDDQKTYDLLQRADTMGVFQLESTPMRALMKSLKPDNFNDISALIALYRPGPMGVNAHNDYADRKNGRKEVVPIHPEFAEVLEDVLAESWGLIVFQEQVQIIAQQVAGYSLGQADLLRRAMGKKKKEILDKEYIPFRDGAKKNGYSDAAIKILWETLVPFADYAFNKAHSAAYGLISYWTAYLKAHYPVEYMAAILTSVKDDKDKTALYLHECRRMGIKVLPPDVNESDLRFTPTGDNIRFGLNAVRSVGVPVVSAIVTAREDKGAYTSFDDYVRKVDQVACNKKTLDCLIKAGAFDSLGHSRRGLTLVAEEVVSNLTKSKKAEAVGQFDLFSATEEFTIPPVVVTPEEWDQKALLAFERDMLGLYVSAHPLDGVDLSHERNTIPVAYLANEDLVDRMDVVVAGIISSVEHKLSKQGKPWAATVVEDLTGSIEVMFFSKTYQQYKDALVQDAVVVLMGQLDKRDGAPKLLASGVRSPVKAPPPSFIPTSQNVMTVELNTDTVAPVLVNRVKELLGKNTGEVPVQVKLLSGRTFPVPNLPVDGKLAVRLQLQQLPEVERITFE